tara:strand:+ start:81 stop:830 length:750 start_codon:yes stop_codon:yes gene_type:complete
MGKSKNKPTFSIITVVLNGEKYLEKTIKSVISQKENFQYIVIDGGSTDNSIKIIKKYSKYINYWISERDNGLYDAFNKGLRKCKGEFVGIINSDDVYTKKAFSIIKKYIDTNPNVDFIFGSVKKHWGILHGYKPEKIFYSWGFYSSHSSGFFIRLKSAKKVGYYNTKYKYHADYDYFFRMIVKKKLSGISTKKNEIVGIFRRGGFSSTIHYRKLFFEEMKIRYDNGQNLFLLFFIAIYKIIKHFKKIIK